MSSRLGVLRHSGAASSSEAGAARVSACVSFRRCAPRRMLPCRWRSVTAGIGCCTHVQVLSLASTGASRQAPRECNGSRCAGSDTSVLAARAQRHRGGRARCRAGGMRGGGTVGSRRARPSCAGGDRFCETGGVLRAGEQLARVESGPTDSPPSGFQADHRGSIPRARLGGCRGERLGPAGDFAT